MRSLTTGLASLLSGSMARHARLLLMLTAALAGFFLLIEFLNALLATGPQDILATTPFEEDEVGLPNGVGLLEASVLGVSLILAAAVLAASLGWPLTRESFRPRLSLAAGVVAAAALAGAGWYLATSGVLGRGVEYSEHTVYRSILESSGLALIAALFLTLIISGSINRYALGATVVAWVVAASAFGFLDTRPVDGLYLFERPTRLEASADYADVVEQYQRTDASLEHETEDPPVEQDEVEEPPPITEITVAPDARAAEADPALAVPVFWVSGAFYTRYLRTSTGDVYEKGEWSQLDLGQIPVDKGVNVPENVLAILSELGRSETVAVPPERLNPALLAYPTVQPVELAPDVIILTPYLEGQVFDAGSVPSASHLVTVDRPAAYYPFSGTLNIPEAVANYQLETLIPRFEPRDIVSAAPAADPVYLQLPEDLPRRVIELAEQFKGEDSPYIRANAIHRFLREKYGFFTPEPGRVYIERPEGHDPVDWFLFERRGGGSNSFSSAFVVLARAAGIPARVVAGWAIETGPEPQTVFSDQNHQWAEIALEGIGWVTFDPTRHDAFPLVEEEQPLPELIEALSGGEEPLEREEAAEALGELGESDALPALVDAAENDVSIAVRLAAETSIHKIGVEELIWLLLNHEDPEMREAAADGLRVAGSSKAVDALRQALSTDVEARVRKASAKALGKIGGESAEQGLLGAALEDVEATVREEAVLGLGKRKARWTAEDLVGVLVNDPDAAVRAAAAWALGEFGEAVALRPLFEARASDPDEAVMEAAAEALANWSVPDLLRDVRTAEDPVQRAAAAELLGELGDILAVPVLALALNDTHEIVRVAALEALKKLGEYVTLENGSALLIVGGEVVGMVAGMSAFSATKPSDRPVFVVEGSRHTSYLRTGAGAVYAAGRWFPTDDTPIPYEADGSQVPQAGFLPTVRAAYPKQDTLRVHSLGSDSSIPAGFVPTSKRLEQIDVSGNYWPEHARFSVDFPLETYEWVSNIDDFSEEQLYAARRMTGFTTPAYTLVPEWVLRGRIHSLAIEITAGHTTPYAQAKAIERYLRTEYTYKFAESLEDATPPEGQDPVDWFLFDKRTGTCGTFSSAFVLLARSIGLPARVVSGWAVSQTPLRQTVTAGWAHQWAEVAFEELGWVSFEPTAGGGPSVRADLESPPTNDPEKLEETLEALEESGAEVVRLENGGALVQRSGGGDGGGNGGGASAGLIGGTSTAQVSELVKIPLFHVEGAANTGYIRTNVGDVYENGGWRQLDPVVVDISQGESVPDEVWRQFSSRTGEFAPLPFERRSSGSLFGIRQDVFRQRGDRIRVFALDGYETLPLRTVPISPDLQNAVVGGTYFPFSGTYQIKDLVWEYSYNSRIASYTQDQYQRAMLAPDSTYLQLPPTVPDRVRELAERVTASHRTPYAKAKALESYLTTTYPYRLADSPDDFPPPGRDPVDWFLFDHREGTCAVYSSAFAVMARSVGIPARVVSGYVVRATNDVQTVHTDQAHQWAEVAFSGIGWVEFEPTGSPDGPLARVNRDAFFEPPPPPPPLDTVTTITKSPSEIRRQQPFTVGGWVNSVTGRFVDGMKVEIYINETKEHGGEKIGEGVTRQGRFDIEVQLPPAMVLGAYQLLARAVEMEGFNESWSDPDISVFSASGLQLTGPSQIPVDVEAVFSGRISEDNGRGASDREVTVAVDGSAVNSVMTDDFGRFSFTQVFTDPGPHWVEVELVGQAFLLDNNARIDLEVTLPTQTTLVTPAAVQVGEEFSVTGTLLGARGETLAGRSVVIHIGEGEAQRVATDASGAFELAATLDSPGAFTVRAAFGGDGPILASGASAAMAVQEASVLRIEGPGSIELGSGGTLMGVLTTGADAPLGQAELSIVDAVGAEITVVTTDDDGVFEYEHSAFFETGPQSLSASYPGADFVVPSVARVNFTVLAPTFLSIEAPDIVRDGENHTLRGRLRDVNGQPVADATVAVTGQGDRTLTTNADGNFTWEAVALFEGTTEGSPHESPRSVEAAFAGTDHLAASSAATGFVVGVPRILLDPLDPVARGGAVEVRGTVLLGNRPLQGVELGVDGVGVARSDADGAFLHRYPVPADSTLGARDVTVEAADLGVSASVPLAVKSAVNITVTPLDKVRPGELVLLRVTALNDRWEGIRGATLRTDGGVQLVTDARGITLLELTPADNEEALTAPVTFTFAGDDQHMPLTYFIGIPITPLGFNWLLWVGAPSVVVALAAAGYAGRRFNLAPLPLIGRRAAMEAPATEELSDDVDVEAIEYRIAVTLGIDFAARADDLPHVWTTGEGIRATVTAVDEEGEAVVGAALVVEVTGEGVAEIETDDAGACVLDWVAGEAGEYAVSVEFVGDGDRLPSTVSRSYRVVDFREEIVRLYNTFLDWARDRTGERLEQATPREVELLVVSRGIPVPQKSLDELISRFEEADYSEHPIARRHYESMYRAWRAVVGE